jgi:Fe-S-cluster-containing dehydrogenase component
MKHFGVINRQASRVKITKYLLPIPKAVQVVCVQCPEPERECQKACPVKGTKAIYYDEKTMHMVIDQKKCLGLKCLKCQQACSAKAVQVCAPVSNKPFVCDLCDTDNTGNRDPQCVNACPYGALYFKSTRIIRDPFWVADQWRKSADEKADLIARRMYPLKRESMGNPGWGSEND